MTESEEKLFDKLMQHDFAYYGHELSKGESKTILQAFEELKKYRAIGTVSEFRELKEKATAKKVVVWADGTEHCPNCDFDNSCIGYGVCIDCGQRLLW